MDRRRLLLLIGTALGASALGFGVPHALRRLARPARPDGPLSAEALALLERAWTGLDPARVADTHLHIVGLGTDGSGCWVNPRMTSLTHPIAYARFSIYRHASGIEDDTHADRDYVRRILELVRAQPRHGRHLILAFDQAHAQDGTPQPEHSEFYVPNGYVTRLAREHPEVFRAVASVHPYRKDAVSELERAVADGAVAVKWLPNAQNIELTSPLCLPLYRKMAELGVPLITHAGEEKAVEAEAAQRFGNPLHLRAPLDAGVKVIVAHCASLGQNPDLDAPGAPWADNFDLFMRLFDGPAYEGRLFGEISALPQFNRAGRPLQTLLDRPDLHARLLNGSDYPLPAITALMQTRKLVALGLITGEERALLNELDAHNPLAFDFALKRTLRSGPRRFSDAVFQPPPGLFPGL